ncbi:unnamed protein product [Blepharisma stoltei]|uniref:VHS domain-containing protein n=1 Tax=Blepharisma stoltei TaxID=1481888 RepID=A0AAU9K4L4_9CILI|nr:unnamed protein product [Blepharisma stoltei]
MKEEDVILLKSAVLSIGNQGLIQEVANKYAKAHKTECRDLLKNLLKIMDSQQLPVYKLQAAKIIEAISETKNLNFIRILGKGLKFYKEIAKYRCESSDMLRGMDIFLADSDIQREASAEFFILVLQCIQDWAQIYRYDRHKNDSIFFKTYQELKEMGVTFPELIPLDVPTEVNTSKIIQNIEKCKDLLASVHRIMMDANPDRKLISRKIKLLIEQKYEFEKEVNTSMENDQFQLINELTQITDEINKAYQIYRYWKKSSIPIKETKRISISRSNLLPQPISKNYSDPNPKISPQVDPQLDYQGSAIENDMAKAALSFSEFDKSPFKGEKGDFELELDPEWKEFKQAYFNLKDKYENALVIITKSEEDYNEINEKLNSAIDENKIKNFKNKELVKKIKELEISVAKNEENQIVIENYKEINKNLENHINELEIQIKADKEEVKRQISINQYMAAQREIAENELKALKDAKGNEKSFTTETVFSFSVCSNKGKIDLSNISNSTLSPVSLTPDISPIKTESIPKEPIDVGTLDFSSNLIAHESKYPTIRHISPILQRDSLNNPITPLKSSQSQSFGIQVQNDDFYLKNLLSKSGILYRNEKIQVDYNLHEEGKIKLAINNNSELDFNNFRLEFIEREGIDFSFQNEKSIIPANTNLELCINYTISSPFENSPIWKLIYNSEINYLKLPITYILSFKSSISKNPQDVWHSLSSEKITRKFYGLRSHIRSMKLLIEYCNLHGIMRAYPDGQRSVVIYGEGDFIALCKITLNKSASAGRIEVRCQDGAVREIMASLIKSLISIE